MDKKIFWIHFEKKKYPQGVKINLLASILKNFSGLYSTIAEIRDYTAKKEYKRNDFVPIFVPKIRKGSIAYGILQKPPSHPVPLFEDDPYKVIEEDVKTIIKIDNTTDENFKDFNEKYPNPKDRVKLLKFSKNIQPYYDEDFRITYTGLEEPFENSELDIQCSKEKRLFINDLISKEQIEDIPKVDGEYIGFKKTWNTFWITDLQGKEIRCDYEEELTKYNLKEDNIYRILGDYSETPGTKPVVSDIIKIIWLGEKDVFNKLRKFYSKKIQEILNFELEDEKGSFKQKYTMETIYNALFFLSRFTTLLKNQIEKDIPLPMIFPGAFGDLELEWSEKIFDIQISIPAKFDSYITIYASDNQENEYYKQIEFDNDLEDLIEWLKNKL